MLLFLNLGFGEIVMIVLVILLFFGSKGVPTLARSLGKAMREFKDATNGIQRDIQESTKDITESVKKSTDLEEH